MKFSSGLNYRVPRKYITEIFRIANDAEDPVASLKSDLVRDKRVAETIRYAVLPDRNIGAAIGTGIFPFKESPYQLGFGDFDVLTAQNRFYVLLNPLITPEKRREMLMYWLEGMSAVEAMCMISIKDQKVHEVYPNLTHEVLLKAIQE